MQYLVLLRRKSESFSNEQFAQGAGDETRRVQELYAAGLLRQIWHRSDIPGACLLFEIPSGQDPSEVVSSLPFVKLGMLEVVICVPLKPYGGFGPSA
jgi:muconolactone delta-isomerase